MDPEGLAELIELILFPGVDEDERGPLFPGAGGAAAAVGVVVDLLGELVVNDEGEAFDIDATGSDVSGDKKLGAFFFEGAHDLVALELGEIALENSDGVAALSELFAENISSVPSASENEAPFFALTVEEFVDEVVLVLFDADGETVVDVTIDDVFGVDLNRFGVGRHTDFDEVADDIRKGGREKPGGFAMFGELDGFADLVLEPHGEHFIGLVEDEVLHGIEGDGLTLEKVEETPGSGDKDVAGALQAGDLNVDFVASGRHFEKDTLLGILGEFKQGLANLFRKLTGGSEDEALDVFVFGIYLCENWKPEGGGFSGAGLSLGHKIESLLYEVGNGLLLDGRRLVNAQFVETLDEIGGYAEGFEVAHSSFGLIPQPQKAKPTD